MRSNPRCGFSLAYFVELTSASRLRVSRSHIFCIIKTGGKFPDQSVDIYAGNRHTGIQWSPHRYLNVFNIVDWRRLMSSLDVIVTRSASCQVMKYPTTSFGVHSKAEDDLLRSVLHTLITLLEVEVYRSFGMYSNSAKYSVIRYCSVRSSSITNYDQMVTLITSNSWRFMLI